MSPLSPLSRRRLAAGATALALAVGSVLIGSASAQAWAPDPHHGSHDSTLTPQTHFTMQPDGSSGLTVGGEHIPNIDIDKKAIATYYGDPGTGIANKTASPYITEMNGIVAHMTAQLPSLYAAAQATGKTPAIVLDTDDTMLWTYDREVSVMHFTFNPVQNNADVLNEVFPATPAMVAFENAAIAQGFQVIGITGRSAAQQAASIDNVTKVGYTGFTTANYFTKWAPGAQPSYITCAAASCTTVEYKAGTRAYLETAAGGNYDIALNVGDQWSDLQGGSADHVVKLPNPTYYLPSPDLPGMNEPQLAPRTHFEMKADGSSGATQGGEGIPNIDSVKKTIAAYYGDPGTGISNKVDSPYIREMRALTQRQGAITAAACFVGKKVHQNPAVILDTDDTTLWTYDMEVAAMHFTFDPVLQNQWVQDQRFPATPYMVDLEKQVQKAGCTVIGLTGRNDDQKAATLGNLAAVGYTGFTPATFYTKWTGVGASQQPSYIHCAAVKCTTIEYKSQTRAYLQTKAGGHYRIVANFGDQFSDLIGGSSLLTVKLPNPTYYLP